MSMIQVPPRLLESEAIARPVAVINGLEARLEAERQTVNRAGHELEAAKAEDRSALARALLDGGKDPGTKATARAEAKLEQAQRMAEALDEALHAARRELVQLVAEETPRLLAEAEQRMAAKREEYVRAVDAVASAHAELQVAAATSAWLREEGLGRYQPQAFVTMAPVSGPTGGSTAVGAVLAALRMVGAPREPRPQPQHRKFPGQQVPEAAR